MGVISVWEVGDLRIGYYSTGGHIKTEKSQKELIHTWPSFLWQERDHCEYNTSTSHICSYLAGNIFVRADLWVYWVSSPDWDEGGWGRGRSQQFLLVSLQVTLFHMCLCSGSLFLSRVVFVSPYCLFCLCVCVSGYQVFHTGQIFNSWSLFTYLFSSCVILSLWYLSVALPVSVCVALWSFFLIPSSLIFSWFPPTKIFPDNSPLSVVLPLIGHFLLPVSPHWSPHATILG